MADLVYSLYVETEARKLLADRHRWNRARNKETGVSFVTVPSGEKVYRVHPLGRGCDCEATQHWNVKMCKHRRAVMLANEEDEQANEQPTPKRRASYADLFRACPCGELIDGRGSSCDRCLAEQTYAERMESKRRSVAARTA